VAEPVAAIGFGDAAEGDVVEAEVVVGSGDGFEVFEAAAGFCGEEFEETAVEGEGLFDV
jgi:hypothetical protein